MQPAFRQVTRDQFATLLDQFPFTRKINAVHMHHTWRPNRAQYRGLDTIVSMWRYHTEQNHWSDIAQHITIAPDGSIWLGRNWNKPPASASGQNGTATAGPFMFEMIGDFDNGRDPFDGEQRRTALEVIARVQNKFGLAPGSLMFHNMMSGKTCPGNSISYTRIIGEVAALQAAGLPQPQPQDSLAPLSADALLSRQVVDDALRMFAQSPAGPGEPADAEPAEAAAVYGVETAFPAPAGAESMRTFGLDAARLLALRPHLVDLNMGQFSSEGEWKTSREDVDAMFEEYLPAALAQARRRNDPLRIMFYAHGGLNSESVGLQIAQQAADWWKANQVYPIFFVWETGGLETIGQLLERANQNAAGLAPRDVFDYTTDLFIEETVRALHGPRIWAGMKLSARLASAAGQPADGGHQAAQPEGGAHYVAQKLAEFCAQHAGQVELHAAGHSAGAVFHAHFIPTALDLGVPPFRSVHFMAPAVRTDVFKDLMKNRSGPGKGIDQLMIYTMRKDFELDDDCMGIYQKSLLYLIYQALEPERKTPILGLEICLRGDPELKQLFGLGGANAHGEVIWSVTPALQGRSASTATRHGSFDNDGATMNSIMRRILDKADTEAIVDYPVEQLALQAIDPWRDQVDWPGLARTRHAPVPSPYTTALAPAAAGIMPGLAAGGALSGADSALLQSLQNLVRQYQPPR